VKAAGGSLLECGGRRLLAAALAFSALVAHADPKEARWYLQMDNDFYFATDRNYSSGLRLGRVAGDGEVDVEWGLLQELYSPERKYWVPGVDDRAPAGRLLVYVARHRTTLALFQTLELAVGVRGPSALGEQVTDIAHKWADAADVDWSRQEGDQIDVQLSGVRTHSVGDFRLHYGAVLGNQQAFLHGGAEWRLGTGSAVAALSPLLRFAATPPPPASAEPGWAMFAGASVRAIARNEMVKRNFDPYGPELQPKDGVARAAAGLAWVGSYGAVTFGLAVDTREFDRQREVHAFGSLTAHVRF
jgi:lipid A 3-O-deacylase